MNAKQGQRLGIILVLAGFAVGIPGFWLLIAHDHFEATARIQVMREVPSDGNVPYDPYFIQAELEVIQSEIVLSKVVNALHLDAEWGNKYAEGRKLELAETLGLLIQSLRLRPVRNTLLIDIGVISEDAAESAKIANAIAEVYSDLCWEKSVQLLNTTYRGMVADRPVQIVDPAQPPTVPIAPNRTLAKALIGVGVLLLVYGFFTFVRNWRRPDEAAT